jgi:hypothetical protein
MKSTGYIIVCNNNIIQGVGTSVDEAWSNVVRDAGPWIGLGGEERHPDEIFLSGMYNVYPCTQGLIDFVADRGGDIWWDLESGVACTADEQEKFNATH